MVNENYLEHILFADTCVSVTADGRPHLGATQYCSAAYVT